MKKRRGYHGNGCGWILRARHPEYDFHLAERGKFFQPGAELRLPIYLNPDVQAFLAARAAQKGIPLSQMVNTLLKREIEMMEAVK